MKTILVVLTIALLASGAARAQNPAPNVVGNWQGTLSVGATTLRLGLHITRSDAGEYGATLDSIDQGASGIPVQQATFSQNVLHLDIPRVRATYEGTVSADGNEIVGTFTQGASLPLTLKRVDAVATLNRPQNPKPPFPYDSVDVSYENRSGSVTLAGTLTLPRAGGPFPAAIMITGSGPQDRDETIVGHKPFLVIADYLTRRGIAVLRVDDRGVGSSTGQAMRATAMDQAGDVLAGVAYLKGRKDIDPKHIGVIGHSEGGIVGPLAASLSPEVSFVVMLAGTGVTLEQIIYLQTELSMRANGASEDAIVRNLARTEILIEILKTEKDEQAAAEKIRAEWATMRSDLPETQRANADAAMAGQLASLNTPDIRSLLTYDPTDALKKLKVPVLALNGSRDLQVPPAQNLPPIAAALKIAGNTDATVTELPGLNHLFQSCKQCTMAEYVTLDETFSPAALQVMGDWLVRHVR